MSNFFSSILVSLKYSKAFFALSWRSFSSSAVRPPGITATLSLPFFLPLPLPAPLPMVSYRGVGLSGAASTACGSSLLGGRAAAGALWAAVSGVVPADAYALWEWRSCGRDGRSCGSGGAQLELPLERCPMLVGTPHVGLPGTSRGGRPHESSNPRETSPKRPCRPGRTEPAQPGQEHGAPGAHRSRAPKPGGRVWT